MKSRPVIIILCSAMVIVMLGFGIAIPLMAFFVIHYGASGSAMGLMMSLYSIMQFVFAPVWGRLSDRIGRKPVLLIGISGYAVAFVLQALSPNLVVFILARTLVGILSSAALPSAMAYIADITTAENRSRGVGLLGASMGIGMIFGPMLGGLLSSFNPALPAGLSSLMQTMVDPETGKVISLSIPFLFSALLALIALPFIHFLLPESLRHEDRQKQTAPGDARFTAMLGALRGSMGFLYTMAFLLAFALANMEGVFGLFAKQQFQMGPAEIGLIMGAMGITSVIEQGFLIHPLTRRFGEERILQGGLVISMIGLLGMALLPTRWGMIVFVLIFNAGNVMLQPSVTSLVSQRAGQNEQGTAMGFNNSFQSLGRGIGPLWAGFAFDVYPTLSFWTGAVIQLIAFFYALRVLGGFGTSRELYTLSE